MKKIFSMFIILLGLNFTPCLIPNAQAQLKFDFIKMPQKISLWINDIKAKCEKSMEWVANSQVGKFVGDGVKYAKEGVKTAQNIAEESMDLYGKTKDSVLESKEYQTAEISKEMATEAARLKKIEEEKQQKLVEIEQQEELLKQQAEAKKANINENQKLAAENGDNTNTQSNELQKIQKELEESLAMLGVSKKQIESDYNNKLLSQAETIAELEKKLEAVSTDKKVSETESTQTLIAQETDKMFGQTDTMGLEDEKKKEAARYDALNDGIDSAIGETSNRFSDQSTSGSKIDTKEGLANTMTGESEVSGINAQVLAEQLDVMLDYIRLNIADIRLQSIDAINGIADLQAAEVSEKFDICQYTDDENRKNAAEWKLYQAQKAKEEISAKVNNAKDKLESAKQTYDEAKGITGEVAAMVEGQDGEIAAESIVGGMAM